MNHAQTLKGLADPLKSDPAQTRSQDRSHRAAWPWAGLWAIAIAAIVMGFGWPAAPAWATGVYDFSPSGANETVIDEAKLFSRLTKGELSQSLNQLADKTGVQVQFVTLHRLDYGETIDSLAQDLFKTWFPEPEARSGRLLIALDVVTNTTAIVEGPNLPPTLTDAIATSVAQETLLFPAREGNYNQAFLDTKDRLTAVLTGEPDPGPPIVETKISAESTFKKAEDTDRGSATIIVVVLLILATVIPMLTYFAYVR